MKQLEITQLENLNGGDVDAVGVVECGIALIALTGTVAGVVALGMTTGPITMWSAWSVAAGLITTPVATALSCLT